jgi:WD40 repeat protein
MATDPTKIKVVKEISRPGILFRIARMPNSGRLFAGSSDYKVYDLDTAAEEIEPVEMVGHKSYVMGLVKTDAHVVSAGYEGQLIWWNPENHEQVRAIEGHERWIRNLTQSPDGGSLVSVADDMSCKVWNAESGELIRTLNGHDAVTEHNMRNMLYCCAVSPNNEFIATADRFCTVVVWEMSTGKEVARMRAEELYTWDPKQRIHAIGGIRSVTFSPDGNALAVGGVGHIGNVDHLDAPARMTVFDWQKQEKTHVFEGDGKFKGLTEQILFHPEGKWVLGAGGDHGGIYTFYDLEKNEVIKQDKAPMHIHSLAMDESCETIYAAGHNKLVVWSIKAEKEAEQPAEEPAAEAEEEAS